MNTKILFLTHLICKILPNTGFWDFKNFMYRLAGVRIGKNVKINSSALLCGTGNIILEDNVWINIGAKILTNKGATVTMKKHSKLGIEALIITGFHEITPYGDNIVGPGTANDVVLEEGCNVCTRVIVVPGIIVGKKADIAAGAVLTKNAPPFWRMAGVPARPIRDLRIPKKSNE